MAEATVLICDLCKKHKPAVVIGKSLDLCEAHDKRTKKLHEHRKQRGPYKKKEPLKSAAKRKGYRPLKLQEAVGRLKVYAKKQNKPFQLKTLIKLMGVNSGSYSTINKAGRMLVKSGFLKKHSHGRWAKYEHNKEAKA